jgi:hypothetical protein
VGEAKVATAEHANLAALEPALAFESTSVRMTGALAVAGAHPRRIVASATVIESGGGAQVHCAGREGGERLGRNTSRNQLAGGAGISGDGSGSGKEVRNFGNVNVKGGGDAEDSDEEGEDEDEEDEEDEEALPAASAWGLGVKLVRPVFRRKDERTTLHEAELNAAREQADKESAARAAAARAEESRRMVADALKRDEEALGLEGDDVGASIGRPDDTDRPEEAAVELDEWRLREIRRLKRDDEAAAAAACEKAETERRRGLTAEERAMEGQDDLRPQKDTRGFHHRGAFYIDESSTQGPGDVRLRPVVEEATFDRAALPSVLRGPRFGRKGQRRLEHVPTDTSRPRDDLLAHVPSQVRDRVERGRGGMTEA